MQTPAPSPEAQAEAQRLAEAKHRQHEVEAAEYRRRADRTARDAAAQWADASDAGHSPYLARKGVGAHGVRFLADGTLLVPMRDAAGTLQNLQRIAPARPADGASEKRFLPGGRKSGLWHQLGQVDGAPVLLLAEGYATAASLHEATGWPAACAFDAGNLVHVAKALRELHPDLPLLVCGDDDRGTEQRTGRNPGRDKAASAARAVHTSEAAAGMVLPEGLPEDGSGGTDFNDLAARAGLDVVRHQIEHAAAAPSIAKPQRAAKSGAGDANGAADVPAHGPCGKNRSTGRGGDGDGGVSGGNSGDGPPGPAQAGDPDGAPERDPFSVTEHGVWFTSRDTEGNDKRPQWLCTRLVVAARTRADDANGWGYLLEFADPDGNAKVWAMPSAMLSGEGAEWAGRLRDMGLQMAPGTRARNLIAQYIDTRRIGARVTCTDRVGWHGPVYVLPSGCIASEAVAAEGRHYVFQSEVGMENTFRRHGELTDWRIDVAARAAGNSRLVFALCCSFAGPTLRPVGMEGGGFNLRGGSGLGKTTCLQVAASVWGRPSYMQGWRATDNALEATAVQHCDGTLILDELGTVDPRVIGECAYMLANGMEKGRNTRGGVNRKRRTWRLLFLSSGELTLADHMAEAGKRTRAGMEVRMADVPLDAGVGLGGFEQLHGHDSARQLAEAIAAQAARYYGTAGRAWLEWLCEHHAELPELLRAMIERHRGEMVPEAASEQVGRVGSRFALVAAAGELATRAGITGWTVGEAARSVRQCFNSWLAARGHLDNGETASMLHQVRRFLELNGDGRFTIWHRALDDRAPKTLNRAGFRWYLDANGKPIKSDSDHLREYGERMRPSDGEAAQAEFMVLREVFRREVCAGCDPDAVAKLLRARGHLVHEADRLTIKHRLPGMGKVACYHIKPSIFADEL